VKFLPQAQLGAKIAQIVLAVHFAELNDKKLPEEKFVQKQQMREVAAIGQLIFSSVE
jgi:hypothetical protein